MNSDVHDASVRSVEGGMESLMYESLIKAGQTAFGLVPDGRKCTLQHAVHSIGKDPKSGPIYQSSHGASVSCSVSVIVWSHCVSELGPTLEDLYAELGRTLVVWGWLEGEMIDAGIDWRHASPDAATDH